jgi:hypothetical protein
MSHRAGGPLGGRPADIGSLDRLGQRRTGRTRVTTKQLEPAKEPAMVDQVTVYEHREALRRSRVITVLVGAALAIVPTLVVRSVFENTVHISDDYQRGSTFSEIGDCERFAETIYQHDLFGDGPYSSPDYATRAQKAFYAGCSRTPLPSAD